MGFLKGITQWFTGDYSYVEIIDHIRNNGPDNLRNAIRKGGVSGPKIMVEKLLRRLNNTWMYNPETNKWDEWQQTENHDVFDDDGIHVASSGIMEKVTD